MTYTHSWPSPERRQQIYAISGPIMLAQFSQGLTSVVGTAMVATLKDTQALAGVGIGTYASLLTCFFVLGFSVAVQTLVARRIGQQRHGEIYQPLTASLYLMLAIGLVITTLVYGFADDLMALFSDDPIVIQQAADYYRYRCLAVAALGINFCCRGFLSGIRKTQFDMVILITVQLSNMLLCYLLIFGHLGFPKLGAAGAGMASCLSILIGTVLYIPITYWQRWSQLLQSPQLAMLKQLLQMGLPNSSQQFFISLAMLVLYWLLAQAGTEDLAIAHAINNIGLLIILAGNGFGTAATTLVSQALGRKEADDAYRWGFDCCLTALPLLLAVCLPLLLWPEAILSLFIPEPGAQLEQAVIPLYITCAIIILRVLTRALGQALLGAGDAKRVMISYAVQQWGFFLPCAAIASLHFSIGITGIWLIQAISWGLQLGLCLWLWRRKSWLNIHLG